MAHRLGLAVVAEGIETKAQLEFLRSQGCEHGQGFLLGKPMPAKAFEQIILAKSSLAARKTVSRSSG
jgi:EAL domain-containing protein (putative c-di-GMP-specific phosphodiesterase class I)